MHKEGYEQEDYPLLYPAIFHELCLRCKNMVKIGDELSQGFCRICAIRMTRCASYGVEIAETACNCPICVEIVTWVKVCGICLKAIWIEGEQVEELYQCWWCEESKKRFLNLFFHNPDKRNKFGTHPSA